MRSSSEFINSTKTKKILVIGSAPSCNIPNSDFERVYAANGALKRAQDFKDKSIIIGVISGYIFTRKTNSCSSAKQIINGSLCNILYSFSEKNHNWPDGVKNIINFNEARYISNLEILRIKTRLLAKADLLKLIILSIKLYSIKELARQIIHLKPKVLHVSTGILALILAINENSNIKNYRLSGITINTGDHYYTGGGLYPSTHNDADILFLKGLKNSRPELTIESDDVLISDLLVRANDF